MKLMKLKENEFAMKSTITEKIGDSYKGLKRVATDTRIVVPQFRDLGLILDVRWQNGPIRSILA